MEEQEDRTEEYIGISHKLQIMSSMMRGVIEGKISGLIVKGSPGIGKSHTLQQVMDAAGSDKTVERHTGKITPVALFHALGDNCSFGSTVILDDTDSVFENGDSMNILKAAVDTRVNRIVRWESTFKGMRYNHFTYEGGVIILTNSTFDSVHYAALLDRFHYIDLTVTLEERIEQIIDISKSDSFDRQNSEMALNWVLANLDNLSDISMRTFVKVVDLVDVGEDWRELAQVTMCNSWSL